MKIKMINYVPNGAVLYSQGADLREAGKAKQDRDSFLRALVREAQSLG